jgi:hypothetical protein
MQFAPLSLGNAGRGKLVEMFEEAVALVEKDLRDEKKPPEKERKIVLTVTVKPTNKDGGVSVTVAAETKLPAALAYATAGVLDGDGKIQQHLPEQEDLSLPAEDLVLRPAFSVKK